MPCDILPRVPPPDAVPDPGRPLVITRRSVVSWVLYDLANTIFSMNIISFYFSLYVRDEVGIERADGVYGLTTAISMGVVFFLSPLLGAMTDHARRRVPFLIVSTVLCITFTALLGQGGLGPSLAFFVIANIAYQAGLQFYDALLAEVSTEENRGRVGGTGVGVGYLGSFVGLGTGYLMLAVLHTGKVPLFQVTALLFLIFALPSFFWIRERGNPRGRGFSRAAIAAAARQVRDTLRASGRYPGLFRFLIGRVFYTDPVNTVIAIMGLYVTNAAARAGLDAGASESFAWGIMITAVGFAVVGGFVWGSIVDRIGPKRTLTIVLWTWIGDFLAVAAAGGLALPLWTFYLTSTVAGLALGGTWAADRPFMLRLSPPSRIGEFYGLYNMVGRFSAVTGPLLWAVIVGWVFRGNPHAGQPAAVLSLAALVVVSYLILRPVSDHRRDWTKSERG